MVVRFLFLFVDWFMGGWWSMRLKGRVLALAYQKGCISVEEVYEVIRGNKSSIKCCLSRLVKEGKLVRIDRGVYCIPEKAK
jgi:predicted transcriptional regulator of viral defense system